MADRPMESQEVTPLLIPVQTVAKLLGISTRSVWRLHSSGKIIEPVRIGSLVRWKRDDLQRWVNEGCPEPSPPPVKPR
jgi:excisionase family DNA binding protein